MPVLQYSGGPNPFRDIEGFTRKIRTKFPGITDKGITQLIRKMVLDHDRVTPNRNIALFGRDIMTDEVEHLPVWQYLARSHKQRILAHPYDAGEKVDGEQEKVSQLELVGRLDRRTVNRSVLISPRGLEQTYVWSQRTGFKQEVTQKDTDLIMSHNSLRRLFTNVDEYGEVQPVRSYTQGIIVREAHTAHNMGDVEALKRQYRRTPTFAGADLKKGT